MPRNMSFAATLPQMNDWRQYVDGLHINIPDDLVVKTLTTRLRWDMLHTWDQLNVVDRCMGIKKGGHAQKLGRIVVIRQKQALLGTITQEEVDREGFPEMAPAEFVALFLALHKGKPLSLDTPVHRIEFRHIVPVSITGIYPQNLDLKNHEPYQAYIASHTFYRDKADAVKKNMKPIPTIFIERHVDDYYAYINRQDPIWLYLVPDVWFFDIKNGYRKEAHEQ